MEASEYLRILEDLGVDVDYLTERHEVNSGRALKMRGERRSIGVYFNRNRRVGIYFAVVPNSAVTIDWTLWNDLPASEVKATDRQCSNVYPNPGIERRALRQLLGV